MKAHLRIILLATLAMLGWQSGASRADYQSRCASCHASTTPLRALPCVQNEVNNLPNLSGLSGAIRAANNRAYLDFKVTAGMGGFAGDGNNGFTSLPAAERNAIVAEIANSCSVAAPVITSGTAPNGTVLSFYSHTYTTTAAPVISGNAGLNPAVNSGFTAGFALQSGALPTGVALDANSGVISGTPTIGGFYTGIIRATNLVGTADTQSFNINIAKLTQTVNFGAAPTPTYAPGGTFSVSVSASTGLPLTYSATGACTVPNANVNSISISTGGACAVTATQAGNNTYSSASATQNITIAKANQTISFGAQTPASRAYSVGLSFALNPAATGAPLVGAITYATNNVQICTVSGTTVAVGPIAGTCVITATQNGNVNYNSISATQNVVINPSPPTAPVILSAVPGNAQATFAFSLSASNGGTPITTYRAACNPGNIFVDGPGSPITLGGLVNATTYDCTVSAINAAGSTASGSVMVTPTDGFVAPGFTSANALSIVVGNTLSLTVTATGNPAPTLSLAGTLPNGVTFTPATGVLGGTPALGTVGTYALTLTASNGTPPNAVQPFTLTVTKLPQIITFLAIAPQTLNTAQVPLSASTGSGLAVAFTSLTPTICSVNGSSVSKLLAGTCTIAANQAGNANYSAAPQATQSFTIANSGINVAAGANDWVNGGGFLQFQACALCHGGVPNGNVLNAANAPSLVAYVYNVGFAGAHPGFPVPPNTQQQAELAAYIGTFVPGTSPLNRAIPFNQATSFAIPNIALGTGTFSSIALVTPPAKGTVTFAGTTATYTPLSGRTGADAFTYRAIGNAGVTETRTATVLIANPPSPVISSAATAIGVTGTAFVYNIVASNGPQSYAATGLPPGLVINTSNGQIYGIPNALGSYPALASATNTGGTGTLSVTFNISGLALAITKSGTGTGTVVSVPAGINCGATCSASFNFNTALTLTATPAAGSVFNGWSGASCTAGICNLTLTAPTSLTATFNLITPPGPPTIGTATPGPSQATISFSPPTNNGGSAVTGYTATCSSAVPASSSASGLTSPIIVSGLTNGVAHLCSVVATNVAGPGAPSAAVSVTPQPDLALLAVQSRKLHATAKHDIAVNTLVGAPLSVEPRSIGNGHTIVFQFNVPIASGVTANVLDALNTPIGTVTGAPSGNDAVVTIGGLPDNQRVTISLANVNGSGNFSVAMGFLIGDVNGTGSVNSSDIAGVKARSGQTTDAANFRFDLNATGTISSSDISAVKARSGLTLP